MWQPWMRYYNWQPWDLERLTPGQIEAGLKDLQDHPPMG
jgi:hypothetical protein